jgi:sulfonate transport system permease protein
MDNRPTAVARHGPLDTIAIGRVRISRDNLIRVATFAGLLIVWELISGVMNRVIMSSPGRMVDALVEMTTDGTLADAWSESLGILVIGLALASTSGVVLGILFGRFRLLDRFLEPILMAIFMTPKVALLPLIALWLGYQDPAKILLVFLFSFFEIFFTVRNGVRTIDRDFIEVARAYSIPESVMLRKVVLPATVPYVITGLRLGMLHGMVGIVLAGFFLENNGIGGLIFDAGGSFRVPQLFAALLTVAGVGLLISIGIRLLERWLAPWKEEAAI